MKIRAHRGGFDESMATTVEIEPTLEAVAKHVGATDPSTVTVEPYGNITAEPYGTTDPRNGWVTHSVKVNGALWGFTDGPLDFYTGEVPLQGMKHVPGETVTTRYLDQFQTAVVEILNFPVYGVRVSSGTPLWVKEGDVAPLVLLLTHHPKCSYCTARFEHNHGYCCGRGMQPSTCGPVEPEFHKRDCGACAFLNIVPDSTERGATNNLCPHYKPSMTMKGQTPPCEPGCFEPNLRAYK